MALFWLGCMCRPIRREFTRRQIFFVSLWRLFAFFCDQNSNPPETWSYLAYFNRNTYNTVNIVELEIHEYFYEHHTKELQTILSIKWCFQSYQQSLGDLTVHEICHLNLSYQMIARRKKYFYWWIDLCGEYDRS